MRIHQFDMVNCHSLQIVVITGFSVPNMGLTVCFSKSSERSYDRYGVPFSLTTSATRRNLIPRLLPSRQHRCVMPHPLPVNDLIFYCRLIELQALLEAFTYFIRLLTSQSIILIVYCKHPYNTTGIQLYCFKPCDYLRHHFILHF